MKSNKTRFLGAFLAILVLILANVSYSLPLMQHMPTKTASNPDRTLASDLSVENVLKTADSLNTDNRAVLEIENKAPEIDTSHPGVPAQEEENGQEDSQYPQVPEQYVPERIDVPELPGQTPEQEEQGQEEGAEEDNQEGSDKVVVAVAEAAKDSSISDRARMFAEQMWGPQQEEDEEESDEGSGNFIGEEMTEGTDSVEVDEKPETGRYGIEDSVVKRPVARFPRDRWHRDLPEMLIKKADLEVTSLKVSKNPAEYGEVVNFEFTIKNKGNKEAEFQYAFYDGIERRKPAKVSEKTVLAAGQEVSGKIKYVYGDLKGKDNQWMGKKIIPRIVRPKIVVDHNGKVAESDETNNVKYTNLWLRPAEESSEESSEETEEENEETEEENEEEIEETEEETEESEEKPEEESEEETGETEEENEEESGQEGSEEPSQCSDGIDNDGDGLIDKADLGCNTPDDDDESDDPVWESEAENESPTVVVRAGPLQGEAPLQVTAQAQTQDVDGYVRYHEWKVLGGSQTLRFPGRGEPAEFQHTFEEPGEYQIKIIVEDDDLARAEDTIGIVVLVEGSEEETEEEDTDEIPVPLLEISPETGETPLNVTLDGSQSHDPDGEILEHSWIVTGPDYNWMEIQNEGSPGVVELQLENIGTYTVKLGVRDQGHKVEWVQAPIEVTEAGSQGNETESNETGENSAPIPILVADPISGEAPLEVTLDGSQSHDLDGQVEKHSWIISGPEGYSYNEIEVEGVPGVLNLTFNDEGTYNVDLVVTDDDGTAQMASAPVEVTGNQTGQDNDDEDGNEDGNDDTDDENEEEDDEDNEETESEDVNVHHIRVESVDYDEATITWHTDLESDSKVYFGTDEEDLDDTEYDSEMTLEDHEIELTGLDEATKYYYQVKSCTEENECETKGPYDFTTLYENPSEHDDEDQEEYESYEFDEQAFLAAIKNSKDGNEESGDNREADTAGSASLAGAEETAEEPVEVIFAAPQYMEVEQEVCKLRFLWWCLWKEVVVKKVPLPDMTGGVEFTI